MYISKTRKKPLRPRDTSPPLAVMSLTLWIKHKLRKTSSPNKQIAFAEPNTCVWNCAPELIGGRLWCRTTVEKSLQLVMQSSSQHAAAICWGLEERRKISETRLGNNAVICLDNLGGARKPVRTGTWTKLPVKQWCATAMGEPQSEGGWRCTVEEHRERWRVHKSKKWRDLLSKVEASTSPCKCCPKPPLHQHLDVKLDW